MGSGMWQHFSPVLGMPGTVNTVAKGEVALLWHLHSGHHLSFVQFENVSRMLSTCCCLLCSTSRKEDEEKTRIS